MDHTCRAVFILEEDHSIPTGHKPLMLEAILHRPIMERAVVQCLADGVQRFLLSARPALLRRRLPASRRERML